MTSPADSSSRPGWIARGCIFLVRCYQATLSPFIGMHCRFQPTCSHYAIEAFRTHGAGRGLWLTARRIGRCHPLGGFGFDPVPPRPEDASRSRNRGDENSRIENQASEKPASEDPESRNRENEKPGNENLAGPEPPTAPKERNP